MPRTLILLTLLGFALRVVYTTTSNPFFDEYITTLAAREILTHGWPRLPSGLFYEHGLLASYLLAPLTALYIDAPYSTWQSAHWSLMLSRWPNVLISTLTIPLIYRLGRAAQLSASGAMFAAALFAISPEGMVWGGRARMYALATLLVLLTVFVAYRGLTHSGYRWLTIGLLGLTLLTQFGVLMLVPALGVAYLIFWTIQIRPKGFWKPFGSSNLLTSSLPWQTISLIAVIIGGVYVKRLGQPLGKPTLEDSQNSPLSELIDTIAYQTTFHFNWSDTVSFLARQFGPSHLLSLLIIAGLCGLIVLFLRLNLTGFRNLSDVTSPFILFCALIFSLLILEIITLLEPFRRNPRYLIMYLPLFYIAVTYPCTLLIDCCRSHTGLPKITNYATRHMPYALLIIFCLITWPDLRITLQTPEPAYQKAFAVVEREWEVGDGMITMNAAGAGLYLRPEQISGFAVERNADQFLLNQKSDPIDRWLGVPWVGSGEALSRLLNEHNRVWFVIDTIRYTNEYFGGNWQAIVKSQMELVWAEENALIYRTKSKRTPLPTQPEQADNTNFNQQIQLVGYSTRLTDGELTLHLFWQAIAPIDTDYTVFVHVRDGANQNIAQKDSQPLNGVYPTSHWQIGETVLDTINLSLPEGYSRDISLVLGLYRLDTLERLPVQDDTSGENGVRLTAE